MLLQKTSTVGTALHKASSKTPRYILLGHRYAPHPWDLSLSWAVQAGPGCQAMSQWAAALASW